MFTHNFDPVLFEIGFLTIRWYSLSYIFGILIGWWYGKKLINRLNLTDVKFDTKEFDDLITYLIIAIIVGGRAGYILFYNPVYYLSNPSEIVKVWEGGMSFHGALIGIIFATYIFSIKKRLKPFFLLIPSLFSVLKFFNFSDKVSSVLLNIGISSKVIILSTQSKL